MSKQSENRPFKVGDLVTNREQWDIDGFGVFPAGSQFTIKDLGVGWINVRRPGWGKRMGLIMHPDDVELV